MWRKFTKWNIHQLLRIVVSDFLDHAPLNALRQYWSKWKDHLHTQLHKFITKLITRFKITVGMVVSWLDIFFFGNKINIRGELINRVVKSFRKLILNYLRKQCKEKEKNFTMLRTKGVSRRTYRTISKFKYFNKFSIDLKRKWFCSVRNVRYSI